MRRASQRPLVRRQRSTPLVALGALALLGLAVAGAVVPSSPAQAHNYLVSSTPEVGAVLTTLPDQFSVTTNDVLLDFGGENTGSAGALEVQGPDGLYYGDGCVAVSGASISTGAALGPAGDYTVIWRVVSTDGHPVSNQFTFTWQPDAGQPVSDGSPAAPVCASAAEATGGVTGGDTDGVADGVADGAAEADSSSTAATTADDEFLSVLAWGGGALLAVAAAVAATLLVLRRPRERSEAGSTTQN